MRSLLAIRYVPARASRSYGLASNSRLFLSFFFTILLVYHCYCDDDQALRVKGKDSLLAGTTDMSYLDFMHHKTESMHALVGRFTSPDENAFFEDSNSLSTLLPPQNYPAVIKPNSININEKIQSVYASYILPSLCPEDNDDGFVESRNILFFVKVTWQLIVLYRQYGSSAVCAISLLQVKDTHAR